MRDKHTEAMQKKREAALEQEKTNRYNYIMQKNLNLVNPYISRPIYTGSVYHSPVLELPKPAFTRPCMNHSPEGLYEDSSINVSQETGFGLELPSDGGSTVTHAPYRNSKKKSGNKPLNNYVEAELKNVVQALPKSVKEHNATDDFFLSMCVMTKDLPETFQIRIQRIMFAAVMEAREEYIQYQHDKLMLSADEATLTRQNSKKVSSIVTVHQAAPKVSPPSGYPVETVVKVIPEGTDIRTTTYVPKRCSFDNTH